MSAWGWFETSPRSEAGFLFRAALAIARATGAAPDFERMRRSIEIAPEELAMLEQMAASGMLPGSLVKAVIAFRAECLAEFDQLIENYRQESAAIPGETSRSVLQSLATVRL